MSTLQAPALLHSYDTSLSVFIAQVLGCKQQKAHRLLGLAGKPSSRTREDWTAARIEPQPKIILQGQTRENNSTTGPEVPLPLKTLPATAPEADSVRYIPPLLLCITRLRFRVLE